MLCHSPNQRTHEELELIFEELLHIKAVAHLSNSVSPTCLPSIHPLNCLLLLHSGISSTPSHSPAPINAHCLLWLQVKRELAAVLLFEPHSKAGTVCKWD